MEEAEARALEWRLAGGRGEAIVMERKEEVKKVGAVNIGPANLRSEGGSGMFVTEVGVTVRWRLQPPLDPELVVITSFLPVLGSVASSLTARGT
jgi:hypothetical protein